MGRIMVEFIMFISQPECNIPCQRAILYNQLYYIISISINTQVIIQNRALSLARYLGLSPIITSTDKMAASSRFATVSEDDFALKCFFFSLF